MPLTNLFPNRSNKKNKNTKNSSKVTTKIEPMSSEDSDVIAVIDELITTVSEESTDIKEMDEGTYVTNSVEMTESGSAVGKSDSFENDEIEPSFKRQENIIKKKIRSVSETESGIESQTKNIRRKFGSEGEILSICQKLIPPEQQKELNEAIGKYIDKIIKDSISKALQNVNVDSVCEDLINDISNPQHSQSGESEEDFMVEQRLSSNSISELVELENAGENETETNDDRKESLHSESDEKVSETESAGNEVDDRTTFGGYLADLDDTGSIDDIKSIEEDSLNSSLCSGFGKLVNSQTNTEESSQSSNEKLCENIDETESIQKTNVNIVDAETVDVEQNVNNVDQPKGKDNFPHENSIGEQIKTESVLENIIEPTEDNSFEESTNKGKLDISLDTNVCEREQQILPHDSTCHQDQELLPAVECARDSDKCLSIVENAEQQDQKLSPTENINVTVDLIAMSPEEESLLLKNDSPIEEHRITPLDADEGLPQQKPPEDERMKVNWKVGNLQVKLPHKTRGKTHLKAWKKRRVVIQPDEFANDPKDPSLVISVYGSDSKKHETTFWYSVCSQKAVVFRSSSRTHRYAFTISESGQAIIHLSAENESATQEWMAAIRAVLWPPSPFMELEKMMSGREFDVAIIDNEFSYHAGLLGMYGFLSITPKKLILLHPQQGYVIQEWYLNTVDKFQFVPQPKTVDVHKVLCMTTCSDSSTGQGEIIFFCNESVTLLQSLASNIHQVLSYHSKQEGGKYQKELEEIAEWLTVPPQDCLNVDDKEHYKVPPRQVKSLLDIPNFIFNKSLSPVASAIYPAPPNSEVLEPLDAVRNKQTTASHDSGISTCTSSEDFLNCSVASFIIGGGPMTGKSSDSELSDAYTPPRTPELKKKLQCEVLKEEQITVTEDN